MLQLTAKSNAALLALPPFGIFIHFKFTGFCTLKVIPFVPDFWSLFDFCSSRSARFDKASWISMSSSFLSSHLQVQLLYLRMACILSVGQIVMISIKINKNAKNKATNVGYLLFICCFTAFLISVHVSPWVERQLRARKTWDGSGQILYVASKTGCIQVKKLVFPFLAIVACDDPSD